MLTQLSCMLTNIYFTDVILFDFIILFVFLFVLCYLLVYRLQLRRTTPCFMCIW